MAIVSMQCYVAGKAVERYIRTSFVDSCVRMFHAFHWFEGFYSSPGAANLGLLGIA